MTINRFKNDGAGRFDRGYQRPGGGLFTAPFVNPDRVTITESDGTLPLLYLFDMEVQKTNANVDSFFVLLAKGPQIVGVDHKLSFGGFTILRVCEGSDIRWTYAGQPISAQTTGPVDSILIFQGPVPSLGDPLVSVTIVDPAAIDQTLSITVSGNDVTIHLATDHLGSLTKTATQVKTLWDATAAAVALASCTLSGAGTAVVAANDLHYLRGAPTLDVTYPCVSTGWTELYDDFVVATDTTFQPSGYYGFFTLFRIFKAATGTTYNLVTGLNVPDEDATVGDWTGAITAAAAEDALISLWSGTWHSGDKYFADTWTVPATKTVDQLWTLLFHAKDPVSGANWTGGVLPLPEVDASSGFSHGSISNLGSGDYSLPNCRINRVGIWWITMRGKNYAWAKMAPIRITPGVPTHIERATDAWESPYSNGPVTCNPGDPNALSLGIYGKDKDGHVATKVQTSAALVVKLLDQGDNICTDVAPTAVTVSLVPAGSPAIPSVLSGTLTRNTIGGFAYFDDLTISGLGVGAKLRFSSAGLATADVAIFPSVLGIWSVPAKVARGEVFKATYTLCDYWGAPLLPTPADPITVSDGTRPGTFHPVALVVTPVLGVATFFGSFLAAGKFNLFGIGDSAHYLDVGALSPDIEVT